MIKILPLLLFACMLCACDRINDPFSGVTAPVVSGSDSVVRKVLLEDYTGHQCITCPAAHAIAQQLQALYGDRLIIVGEHVGQLADPVAGNYATNFHTPEGDAYYAHWNTDIIPRALVDRTIYGNLVLLSKDNWAAAVAAAMDQPEDLKLWFDAFSYNAATRVVTTTVKCTALNAINQTLNLTVQLTEDHVIDYQLDQNANPPDVPNYDHRHVLRGNLNGAWGEALFSNSAAIGTTMTRTLSWTLPASVLNPDNCDLVAYVYNAQGTTNEYQVRQAEEHKFQP